MKALASKRNFGNEKPKGIGHDQQVEAGVMGVKNGKSARLGNQYIAVRAGAEVTATSA